MDGEPLRPPQDLPAARTLGSSPPPPYFDSKLEAWVLSRYSDVQAAFHESNLFPVGPKGEGQLAAEDRMAQAKIRTATLAGLSPAKLAEWELEFSPLAQEIATTLPASRPVDVIGELARPWSLALAVGVTGADPSQAQALAALAAKVSATTADPDDAGLKLSAAGAGEELDRALQNGAQPMAGPAFVALSQTIPYLLANAWWVLLNHPVELGRLRANRDLLPRALEELLRVAGLVRILHRQAIANVKLGDLRIECGQRVHLMVEVANFDPAQFPEPHRLDLSRRSFGHFALGAGQHSCAAAALIRMATGVATRVFVDNFTPTELAGPVEWHGGSGFRWPAPVFAQRRPA